MKELSLEINQGEFFVILGKSGAGKTLILESIAGLHKISGNIEIGGIDMSNVLPEKRGVGFVYQDFALFPNLNVEENILFSNKYRKLKNPKEIFDDIVDFLDLKDLLKRKIDNLSGGEKQRIAIARAIFSKPKVLLLDEPLSAIDPTFRNSIMKFLKKIHSRYNLTTIHVTHNFREAAYLSDRIGVIIDGNLEQIGTANEVLSSPKNIKVAEFLGFKNIFSASIIGKSGNYFSIDPNFINISKNALNFDINLNGTLEDFAEVVDHCKIFIKVNNNEFFVKMPIRSFKKLKLNIGDKVYLGFNEKDISCF